MPQVRVGWRANTGQAQASQSVSTLLASLYGAWNGDAATNELSKSLYGAWNAENTTNILDTNIYSVFTDTTTYNLTGITTSQIGLWDAEENGLLDKVGTNNLISFASATYSNVDFKIGTQGYTFPTSSYFQLSNNNTWNFTGDFSVSFWIKATWPGVGTCYPLSNNVLVGGLNNGWDLRVNGALPVFEAFSNGTTVFSLQSKVKATTGVWNHIAATRNGSLVSIYVNGLQGGTSSVTGTISYAPTSYSSIGAKKESSTTISGPISGYSGKMDDIALWSRSLSYEEIKTIYNSYIGQTYPYTSPTLKAIDKYQSFTGFMSNSGVSTVTGKTGNAISFTASSCIVMDDLSLWKFTGDFSISLWIKATATITGNPAIISKHDGIRGWFIQLQNSGALIFNGSDSSVQTPTIQASIGTITTNAWYHVVVSFTDNSNVKCYLNGSLTSTTSTISKNILYDYTNIFCSATIGARMSNVSGTSPIISEFFTGILDDINIWDRALSDNEAAQLYNGSNGVEYPYSGKSLSSPNDNFGTNHGTLMNGCTFTTGISGNAFSFDGVNDYLQFPNTSMRFTGDFSISCFVYFNSFSAYNDIVGNYYGINVSNRYGFALYQQSNKIRFATYNVSTAITVGSTTLATGQWYHIIVTKTSNNIPKIYLNGVLETTTSNSGSTPQGQNPAYDANLNIPKLGAEYENGVWSGYLNGKIDALNIWTKELSQDEVTQLYNSGTGAQYPFTGTFSSAANVLGMDNGTLVNGCYLSDGKIGKAFTFDGVNDYVALPDNSLNFTGDFTTSFWFYANSFSGNPQDSFVTCENWTSPNDNGWYIFHYQGNLCFSVYNGTNATGWKSSTTLSTGTWTHVVVVKNRSVAPKFYINGTLVNSILRNGTDTTLNPGYVTTQYCSLGADRYAANTIQAYFNGKIDAVSVWQKELTQAEVTELYNSGTGKQITATPIVQTGLVLNLDASRKSSYPAIGATWSDISGSGNNGTMVNSPVFGTASDGQISFNGTNQYVVIPDSTTNRFGNQFSMSLSFYWDGVSRTNNNLFAKRNADPYNSYTFAINNGDAYNGGTGRTFMFFGRADLNTADVLLTYDLGTTPRNIIATVVIDANSQKLFINGTIVANAAVNLTGKTFNVTGRQLVIGATRDNASGYFNYANAKIYSAQLYNRSLADSEVLQNFNSYKTRLGL